MARKPQELRPVMTRIPEALRRRLERSGEKNGRSMNGEIIHRLEKSFLKDNNEALMKAVCQDIIDAMDVRLSGKPIDSIPLGQRAIALALKDPDDES